MTDAERHLWQWLRQRQLDGLRFRRQMPLGTYIVDFVCLERRLVIELDGGHHQNQRDYDENRDRWLEEQGFVVLRFWNHEVLTNVEGVLMRIQQAACDPPPQPSPAGGEGAISAQQEAGRIQENFEELGI
jgi:very-short-patch-repair endonuclease